MSDLGQLSFGTVGKDCTEVWMGMGNGHLEANNDMHYRSMAWA